MATAVVNISLATKALCPHLVIVGELRPLTVKVGAAAVLAAVAFHITVNPATINVAGGANVTVCA
jgi:hypothetical protein